MDNVTVVDHPLVQHKLTLLRDKNRSTAGFRRLIKEVALFLGYEVTRDLPMTKEHIETPVAEMEAPKLMGKKLVFASILRAGEGMIEALIELVPSARIAHVGLYRDPDTLQPVQYYFKAPDDIADRLVIVVDPMLATGNSVSHAIQLLKDEGANNLRLLCLLAAPEGIAAMRERHPDVPIVTAAIDSHLNDHGYIVPGLGDAGDRMFGTK